METVLIVDDNPHNCEFMSDILTTWGYKILVVQQGTKAITVARSESPDIILLDVMLPGMNGFEVCHEIKTNVLTRDIPVIMLTVLSEADDRLRGLTVGADHFMSKPLNYSELKFRIAALIRQKQRIDQMEEGQAVVDTLLFLLRLKDRQLYEHTCQVRDYCDKVSRILHLPYGQHERLVKAACLHEIGRIVDDTPSHLLTGRQILSHLKLGSRLAALLPAGHDTVEGDDAPAILAVVKRFVQLLASLPDKPSCMEQLRQEYPAAGCAGILDALEQVLLDEQFYRKLNSRFQ